MMRRLLAALVLALVFLRELWLSSVSVARAAFTPRPKTRSAIVAVPIALRTDLGISLLANMVTLTPGTCSLHVGADRRTLYVHALDADDPQAVADEIKAVFERRVAAVEGAAR